MSSLLEKRFPFPASIDPERKQDQEDPVLNEIPVPPLRQQLDSPFPMPDLPAWMQERNVLWDCLREKKAVIHEEIPIKVTLSNGSILDEVAYRSTPASIAKNISTSLFQNLIVAEVNGQLWDVGRHLEGDCDLILHTFDSPVGKKVFWRSSAYILAEALELIYNCHLTIGLPLEEGGFYYDLALQGEKTAITEADYETIQEAVVKMIGQKQTFERLVLSKKEALQLFSCNKYKKAIINDKISEDGTVTAYRCGSLVDLCKGPHIPHTGRIKAFEITKNSGVYWLGKQENDLLQRVYGISFPNKKLFKEWQTFQEEAKRRDHRLIGKNQELFFMDTLSPGSPFFLPHGTIIYNRLIEFIRKAYRERGFTEVISPNIFNVKLWEISGHWENYKENIFSFDVEKQPFALKPMNCPGHCLIFRHRSRSYRELPLRFADFGVLHRNESGGSLTGLTRVRRFQQDDAHIFCRPEQIRDELKNALSFMEHVYGIFHFTFELELSTRPEKFLGDIEVWNRAEEIMEEILVASGHPWKLNPGDGAFYGPKIDIHIRDSLRRSHQTATIQLDFQLPEQFKLEFQTEGREGEPVTQRPVIIHRAIFGSVERFMAILMEHVAGEWPVWLSPRQYLVIPVTDKNNAYAEKIQRHLFHAGLYAEADLSPGRVFLKKVTLACKGYFNYILVVGNTEEREETVRVRSKKLDFGTKPLAQFIQDAEDANNHYRSYLYEERLGTPVETKKKSERRDRTDRR